MVRMTGVGACLTNLRMKVCVTRGRAVPWLQNAVTYYRYVSRYADIEGT